MWVFCGQMGKACSSCTVRYTHIDAKPLVTRVKQVGKSGGGPSPSKVTDSTTNAKRALRSTIITCAFQYIIIWRRSTGI